MEVSYEDLKERYRNLSTDELLQISLAGNLTRQAAELLEVELKQRDVSVDDIETAKETALLLAERREKTHRRAEKHTMRFARVFIVAAVIALIGLAKKFLSE